MIRKFCFTLGTLFVLLDGCTAQKFISTEGIQSAILEGQRAKGRFQGLELQDSGVSFGQAFAGAMAGAQMPSGYRLVIYSPLEWVKQQVSNAAREYHQFSAANLTTSMVENVVRVRVYPSTPTYVTSKGAMLASSVDHVVIRDAQRQRVVQPIRTEQFSESAQNAMGASLAYHGVDAIFDMKEIEALRDQNEKRCRSFAHHPRGLSDDAMP